MSTEKKSANAETLIQCQCGTHLLKVQSEVDYYDDTVSNVTRFHQDINLAMFYYGIESHKSNFWHRLIIAWKYLWSGKMFSDQLSLNQEEAQKLADFINKNLIKGSY